jgi:hypothetical protein
MESPVLKKSLYRPPGFCAAAAANARSTPATFVTSRPGAVMTATSGNCSPLPNVFSVR